MIHPLIFISQRPHWVVATSDSKSPIKVNMSTNKAFLHVSLFVCAALCGTLQQCFGDEAPLYKFVMKDAMGKDISLSEYKGKVVLLVNVASECGYTDGHYKELVELQNLYSSQGFTVLAFPCNQFGKQEPEDDKSILKFVKEKYSVNFPVFSKIEVGGEHAHPLYVYLYRATSEFPHWNFGKYLVDRSGNVIKFFSQNVSPKQCIFFIEKLLNNEPIDSQHTDL